VDITVSRADAIINISGWTGTYDGAAHGASGSATGVLGENLTSMLNLGSSFTNVPGGTATWIFTDTTGNYNDDASTVDIAISRADAMINVFGWTGTYDGAAHGATGSATGVLGENLTTMLDLGASFTNVPGGTATWTFTDTTGNYNDDTGTVDITISRATLTVDGITADSRTYDGTTDAILSLGGATLVGVLGSDDVTLETGSAQGTFVTRNAGTGVTVLVSGLALSGSDAPNYTLTQPTAMADIDQAALTITAVTNTKTYNGDTSAAGVPTVVGLQDGDTVTGLSETYDTPNAGTGKTLSVATFIVNDGNGGNNYSVTLFDDTTGVINEATLTITASNRSKTYGDTVTFAGTEFTAAGLVGSDNVTGVTLTSAGAAAAAAAGTHEIVPSAAAGTGMENYEITYVNGTLTVNPKALIITANDRTKTYGDAVTFAGTEFTAIGLVNADTVTSVTLASAGAAASAEAVGSPYSIVASAAVGTGLGNYTISYVNSALTVSKRGTGCSVTSSLARSKRGKPVTFTATLTDPQATGTVIFRDGGTVLGSSTISDGMATYSSSDLSVGSHFITAAYSADDNFAGNTSPAITHVVKKAAGVNWWLIIGIILAGLLVSLFFFFLWFRRKRKETLWDVRARHAYA
ncbi:MAG: YDG domain-containing protein, partial [Methanomicrobiales archaeon]|nr:YDG domain-containing protein [Methanomicrobiales archaeon]